MRKFWRVGSIYLKCKSLLKTGYSIEDSENNLTLSVSALVPLKILF